MSVSKRVSTMTESEPMWNLTVRQCLACCDGCLQSLLNARPCIWLCACAMRVRVLRRVRYFFSRKPKQITLRNLQPNWTELQLLLHQRHYANAFSGRMNRCGRTACRLWFIWRTRRIADSGGNGSLDFSLMNVCHSLWAVRHMRFKSTNSMLLFVPYLFC